MPTAKDPTRQQAVDRHSAALHMTATIQLNLGFCKTEKFMGDVEQLLERALAAAKSHLDRAALDVLELDFGRPIPRKPNLTVVQP